MRIALIVILVLAVIFFGGCLLIAQYLFRMAITRAGVKSGPENLSELQKKHHAIVDEEVKWSETANKQKVEITTYDGLKVVGEFYPAANAKRTVICAHGFRAFGFKDFGPMVRYYSSNETNVLLMRQRSHGESEGGYLCYGVKERYDVQKWAELINSELVPEKLPIYLHGVSMGCGTVVMASDVELPENVMGVIADCGYTSAWDEFEYILGTNFHLPNWPILYMANAICQIFAGWEMREVNTLDIMDHEKYPMLFIHGDADDFVPTKMGVQNYERCVSKKKLVLFKDAGHALSWASDLELYKKIVYEFFEECEQTK